MNRHNSYPLYDFTVSPLTSGYCDKDFCKEEKNKYRIKNSAVFQRNFATIKVHGSYQDRVLEYTVFNNSGKPLLNYEIHENDLKY